MKRLSNFMKSIKLSKCVNEMTYNKEYFKKGCIILSLSSITTYFLASYYFKQKNEKIAQKMFDAHNQNPFILNQFLSYNHNNKLHNTLTKINDDNENNENVFKNKLAIATGEFDYTKELHIPKRYNGQDGYYVFSPFYIFEDNTLETAHYYDDPNHKHQEHKKAAPVIVNRGWIPSHLKDRRTRPYDINKGRETISGVIKFNPDRFNYTIPNNSAKDIWPNINIQEFCYYFSVATTNHLKFYLELNNSDNQDVYPFPIIKDNYLEEKNYYLEYFNKIILLSGIGFGCMSLV